jgi:hypothetical protein
MSIEILLVDFSIENYGSDGQSSRFCIADHGPPKVPGAVQTCGIASSRRALSAYPIFIAPGFILFSESGWERSAGFCWINLSCQKWLETSRF